MQITFVLPGPGDVPSGGVRVVYEYANRLARRGHTVAVVHPAILYVDTPVHQMARLALRYTARGIAGRFRPSKWFEIDPSVRMLWVPSLSERYIPIGDIVIATSWQTAEWVARYPRSKGEGFYLLQHLELWDGREDRVYATWRSPLRKIVIARWLQEIASTMGQESTYIPNGLNFESFHPIPAAIRSSRTAAMLYHEYSWKGTQDGIRALARVRETIPDLRAILFGIWKPPADLPDWIQYFYRPSQEQLREIYNVAAVFVAPSWSEGWGLPATEAMMCGAAVAATDIGGHREFAIDGQTALLSAPKAPEALAGNIQRLFQDSALRERVAAGGYAFVQQFTWERAVTALEAALSGSFPARRAQTSILDSASS